MTRLAAIEKMEYFPTPDRVAEMIRERLPISSDLNVLDPCCGGGEAVKACFGEVFKTRWGTNSRTFYGIELDRERAKIAKKNLKNVLVGSVFNAYASKESFNAIFLNPPYDADELGGRQEFTFLQASTPWLSSQGFLIYIIPRWVMDRVDVRTHLWTYYNPSVVWDFPMPEANAYDQVIGVFRKRATPLRTIEGQPPMFKAIGPIDECPSLGDGWVHGTRIEMFTMVDFDPKAYVNDLPVYRSSGWDYLTSDKSNLSHRPLMAPRPGHQAMLLAAGQINGADLGGFIIKGSSEKKVTEIPSVDEETVTYRESIVSRISSLDTSTGEFDSWVVNDNPDKTIQWFQDYGPALAKAVVDLHDPLYKDSHFDKFKAKLATLRKPRKCLPGHDTPFYPQLQLDMAASIAHLWTKVKGEDSKGAIINGEMGVGKTTIGILASEFANNKRVIVVCPTHLVSKWQREVLELTGKAAWTAKSVLDVDAYFNSGARYLILSKETLKLGAKWVPVFAKKAQAYWADGGDGTVVRKLGHMAKCPDCGLNPWGEGQNLLYTDAVKLKDMVKCVHCKSPCWQALPISDKGTTRWPLAKYINARHGNRYSVIIDEAHQHSKAESDQALASAALAARAIKILDMTGTLYGGRASSIFYLLYRLVPSFRKLYKYTDVKLFVERYGLFEAIRKEEERVSVYGYKKGLAGGRLREIPGMSPSMIPLLLPFTNFAKLKDLGEVLPPYHEEVVLLDHDEDCHRAAVKLQRDILPHLRECPKALGAYLMACLGYPDNPTQAEDINGYDRDDNLVFTAHAPAIDLTGRLTPKDQYVIDTVLAEKEAGRKVLVYVGQVNKRDVRPRLMAAFAQQGINAVVLDGSISPAKREAWIEAQAKKGFDVLVTNGKLVETGLDLMFGHTIIQYGIEYSLHTLRQSSRRSWRLGQDKNIRFILLGYRGTMQDVALGLIAKKMRAAEMIEGDDVGGLGQTDESGQNFFVELAQKCLQYV